jgi:hypothetical protein
MLALIALVLTIAPWHGKDLPTATAAAAKYKLTVTGTPGTIAHLRTSNVAHGWIAAFCNDRVCSPGRVDQPIPANGTVTLQFELIREVESAPHASGATIISGNDKIVVAPVSR